MTKPLAAWVYFLTRLATVSMAHFSLGNSPVLSFEYTNSPLIDSSKQPPPDGINFSSEIFCLKVVSSLVVRLTA